VDIHSLQALLGWGIYVTRVDWRLLPCVKAGEVTANHMVRNDDRVTDTQSDREDGKSTGNVNMFPRFLMERFSRVVYSR